MKSLIIGFCVALVAAIGATFLVLQAQPKPSTQPTTSITTATVQVLDSADCTDTCRTCTNGSTVYDVADLQSIYAKPADNIELISFEEPPLAQRRELLPAPREVK